MPCLVLSRVPASLRDLTPAQARFCLAATRFLQQDLNLDIRGKSLLVGFSGGADSTALLLSLHCLAPLFNFTLTAAHLDHGLRPSSAQEADLCRAFCRSLGIAFVSERCDIAAKGKHRHSGLEEAGREARYSFFNKEAAKLGCDWILTAHQNNDLAEDLLMRLIRGSGWPALSGMPAVDSARKLLRPFLLTTRKDIEDFLLSFALTWLQDESNTDCAYLRNRIRMELLPLILRENPAFLANVAGLWRLGRIDEAYFEALVPCADQLEHFTLEMLCKDLPKSLPRDVKRLSQALSALEDAHAPLAPAGTCACDSPPAAHDDPRGHPGAVSQALIMRAGQLARLPKALRLRFYKKTLSRLGPGQALLPSLLALDRAWLSGHSGTTHRFPGRKAALVDKKNILWIKS